MYKKKHFLFVCGLLLLVSGGLYAQTAQDLRFGAPISGNLTLGGEQWYRVRSNEAGIITVETSGSLDTFLEAFDASNTNTQIASNDDGGENSNARLEIAVDAGRTLLFKLRGYDNNESGTYRIWASFRSFPVAVELRIGTAVSGNLSAGGEQLYSVRASETGFLVLETISNIDTYLRAYDTSYRLLSENDDGGDDGNARLEIPIETGKTYLFRLTGYNSSESGPFRILASFEPIPADTARNTERSRAVVLQLGESFPIFFYTAGESRWFRYDISRDGTVFVVQTRGQLDTIMSFYDARGNLIADNDDGGEETNALISQRLNRGIVFIEVKELNGKIGRCTLHAETR